VLELNQIYQGDCLELLKEIPDGSIDLVLTDPPYGIDFKSSWQTYQKEITNDGFQDWQDTMATVLPELKRVTSDKGVCCCFMGGGGKLPVSAIFTLKFVEFFHLIQTVIWDKKTIGLGWKYRPSYEAIIVGSKSKSDYHWFTDRADVSNIVRINNVIPDRSKHPTVKPLKLMEHFILLHSQPGMTVLDPFAGSGTTLEAAKLLGRNFIGMELEPKYIEMARRRLAQEVFVV